ncbi:MAG TPA: hypothetical protein VLB76_10020 [Thermoanaerobaculia bacterium]|jgi:hypothetical protein|nr:hypothetical protein [Thermoanaerobaculia bacterium]
MSTEPLPGPPVSLPPRRSRIDFNQVLGILGILAAILGPFLPSLQSPGSPNSVGHPPLLLVSNPFVPEYWNPGEVLYAVNLSAAVIFVVAWWTGGYLARELKYFSRMWLLWWIGLVLFYLSRIIITGGSLQPRLDVILNNANTAFLFLAYVGLAYPKNTDYNNRPKVFQRLAAWVVAAFFVLALVTSFAPDGEGIFIAKLLSGCYAGLVFCFLAARLESLIPQQYAIISLVFLYSFVQVLWSFEGVQGVLSGTVVFALAFLGKVSLGILVLVNHAQIADRASKYFEVKEETAKAASVIQFQKTPGGF